MATGPALYLASTPLTALLAAAVARAQGAPAWLVLLEDYADAARWARLLGAWRDSPFQHIGLIAGRATEGRAAAAGVAGTGRIARERSKRVLRLQALASLAAIDGELRPAQVCVGNDRRPETQYALELAARRNGGPCGVYLDDGLFTYVGDAHSRPWARRLIDAPLKKLAWGRWWQGAAQAGTTRWITQAWLAWPALARDRDPARARHALPRAWCVDRAMARLARDAAREFLGSSARPRQRLLLALPHTRVLGDAAPRLRELVAALAARGGGCAVKYHPRETAADPAGLVACGATLLPAGIALELLAARMPPGATLAGEASTALAAARWLRPDLHVLDLGYSGHAFATRARAFLAGIGVAPGTLKALARAG
ncbi:MAG TPA: hypothetical protein PLC02_02475 [Pseudomonadota bacterium]|nr:hypothetical protein [Pseudomonadota bacterium]